MCSRVCRGPRRGLTRRTRARGARTQGRPIQEAGPPRGRGSVRPPSPSVPGPRGRRALFALALAACARAPAAAHPQPEAPAAPAAPPRLAELHLIPTGARPAAPLPSRDDGGPRHVFAVQGRVVLRGPGHRDHTPLPGRLAAGVAAVGALGERGLVAVDGAGVVWRWHERAGRHEGPTRVALPRLSLPADAARTLVRADLPFDAIDGQVVVVAGGQAYRVAPDGRLRRLRLPNLVRAEDARLFGPDRVLVQTGPGRFLFVLGDAPAVPLRTRGRRFRLARGPFGRAVLESGGVAYGVEADGSLREMPSRGSPHVLPSQGWGPQGAELRRAQLAAAGSACTSASPRDGPRRCPWSEVPTRASSCATTPAARIRRAWASRASRGVDGASGSSPRGRASSRPDEGRVRVGARTSRAPWVDRARPPAYFSAH